VKRLFIAAAVLTAGGFIVAIYLVVENANLESRPAIAASLDRSQSKLTARVEVSHLKTDHRLALKVDLATLKRGRTIGDIHPFQKRGRLPLERTYVGPDADGNVDQAVSVAIPAGGSYTDLVIKAFTGEKNRSCTEAEAEGPDPGTACTFLALDPARGGG
jgi:hypothetical protein